MREIDRLSDTLPASRAPLRLDQDSSILVKQADEARRLLRKKSGVLKKFPALFVDFKDLEDSLDSLHQTLLQRQMHQANKAILVSAKIRSGFWQPFEKEGEGLYAFLLIMVIFILYMVYQNPIAEFIIRVARVSIPKEVIIVMLFPILAVFQFSIMIAILSAAHFVWQYFPQQRPSSRQDAVINMQDNEYDILISRTIETIHRINTSITKKLLQLNRSQGHQFKCIDDFDQCRTGLGKSWFVCVIMFSVCVVNQIDFLKSQKTDAV